MIVLGISTSHESGAAVVRDGEVLACVNEERLNRKKACDGLPERSIEMVLSLAGISSGDVDRVAVANIIHRASQPMNNDFRRDDSSNWDVKLIEVLDNFGLVAPILGTRIGVELYRKVFSWNRKKYIEPLKAYLGNIGVTAPLTFVDHHHAHVASAGFVTGWDSGLIISNDGFGDGYCGRVCLMQGMALQEINTIPMYHSVGSYYNYVTLLCGFLRFYHAGKTTGLVAYGNPEKTLPVFEKKFSFDKKNNQYVNHGNIFMNEIKKLKKTFKETSRENVAAGMQKHLERVVVEYVQHFIQKSGEKKIALVGGLHANVRLNQLIGELSDIEEIVIHPNMGDGGMPLGAALYVQAESKKNETKKNTPKNYRLHDVFLGPEFSIEDMEKAIIENPGQYNVTRVEDPCRLIAEKLAKNKIVARFVGRMEYGPRALGNRSIFYSAKDPSVNIWLNKQLNRTEFMPFAPVIRFEDASKYLIGFSDRTSYTAEFMTITFNVTEQFRREAPAAVHIDETARPQLVKKDKNPELYRILTEYKKISGHSVFINTSFNMHEEPIVCAPEEAVRCFVNSNIDCLALGPFVLEYA